jgi:SAM-dependent methyltransferase
MPTSDGYGSTHATGPDSDPLAVFLSSPGSHLADILYIYFRIYKKKVLWRFFRDALDRIEPQRDDVVCIADVGASMGFDTLYLLRMLTDSFARPMPFQRTELSLVEGDSELIARGENLLRATLPPAGVAFRYFRHPLVEAIPLKEQSQHLVICSEVVEHLEEPGKLFREMFRILRPGGFLILTTDNSPNFFQRIRRIPVWLAGKYPQTYARPSKEAEIVAEMMFEGRKYPIYGHINLNPTRVWEKAARASGFEIARYGTYESVRRGGGSKSPFALACYFAAGAIVYHLLPAHIGRFFGDSTALLLKKPGV